MLFRLGQKVRQKTVMYHSLKNLIGTIVKLPTPDENYYYTEFLMPQLMNEPQTWYFNENDLIADTKFQYGYNI